MLSACEGPSRPSARASPTICSSIMTRAGAAEPYRLPIISSLFWRCWKGSCDPQAIFLSSGVWGSSSAERRLVSTFHLLKGG